MAYLFNALDDQSDEQGKQNIFGGQQTDQGTTSGTEAVEKPGVQTQPSGGGGGGSVGQAPAPSKATQQSYNPQAASQAYASAAKSMKLPSAALSSAENSLSKGNQQLQEQANAYNQKAQDTAKTYDIDQGTLAKAAEGDQAAYQKTSQRLLGNMAPENFEAFGGLSTLPSIQNVRDPASLYRQEVGPNYSAGQSRFDAAMLRRNPEFIKQQQDILARGKALEEENAKRVTEETEKARGLLKGEYEKSTADIRNRLGAMGENIVSQAKAKEQAEEARRAGLDPKALAAAQQDQIKAQIREDLKNADPRSQQARSLQYLNDNYDLSQFADINKDVDWRSYIGSPEAKQYNAIEGLLGNADMLTPSEAGAGPESNFRSNDAYRYILDQLQGRRNQADIAGQSEADKIREAATARAQQTQADLNAQYAAVLPQYQQYNAGDFQGQIIPTAGGGGFNYQTDQAPPQVDWKGILTGEEASRLNAIDQDLGVVNPGNYQAQGQNYYQNLKAMQDYIARKQQINETGKTGPTNASGILIRSPNNSLKPMIPNPNLAR